MTSFFLIAIILIIGISFTAIRNKREPASAGRFFSLNAMTGKLLLVAKRFPISILLVVGLASLFFILINGNEDDVSFQLWLFLPVGAFISVAATLFAEDFVNQIKTYAITLAVVALWGVYCFLLPSSDHDMWLGEGIEVFSIAFAAFWAMFFISFFKKNKDRSFWNFTTQMLFHISLAICFAGILFGGLSLAIVAVEMLFGADTDGEVFANLAVLCFALFAPLYFLANIPAKADKQSDEMYYTKTQKVLALYILTPILALYAVILYAYLFKIIFTWELPNGFVSWLVTALALGGLLVITFLFPVREEDDNKVVNFISRWFGLIILPLLLLMSIGIFRRIGDYGLTINRVYILLLNLWFYGIYIYLFLTNSKHVKWILISPVVAGLLLSIGPWSVANIVKYVRTSEVEAVFSKPVSQEEAQTILAALPQEEQNRMASSLEYLHENYGEESVQPFFTYEVDSYAWAFVNDLGLDADNTVVEVAEPKERWFSFQSQTDTPMNIENFNAFLPVNLHSENIEYLEGNTIITIKIDDVRSISVPVLQMVQDYFQEDTSDSEPNRIIEGEDYILWINNCYGYYNASKGSIDINSLEGMLFYKR
jgi:hypothetical protein